MINDVVGSSSAPLPTRRGFLATAAAVTVAGLAGCASSAGGADATTTPAGAPLNATPTTGEAIPDAAGDTTAISNGGISRPATTPSSHPTTTFSDNDWPFQRIHPVEHKGELLNPHIGTATFQRFNGDPLEPTEHWNDGRGPLVFPKFNGNVHNVHYPQTTVAYCRWGWTYIEPRQGEYRWDIIENALRAATERGQTLQARLEPSAGGTPVPDWYWKAGGTKDVHSLADCNNPLYLKLFGKLISEFGDRFDGHPALESFDIAYGGSCGETGGNATPKAANDLVDVYLDTLPRTQLLAMLGTSGGTYAMQKRKDIGWRVDCFGDINIISNGQGSSGWCEMYDAYPRSLVQCGAVDRWRTAPVSMETCGTVGIWYQRHYDLDFIIEQGWKYHMSTFMPKSCAIPEAVSAKIDAFNRRLGYRYVLRQIELPWKATPGHPMRVTAWIDNVGVAPIYRPYRMAMRFTQGAVSRIAHLTADPRQWSPDNNIWFEEKLTAPSGLQPGTAKVEIGLVDEFDQAKVKFAIEGAGPDNWHHVADIEIAIM